MAWQVFVKITDLPVGKVYENRKDAEAYCLQLNGNCSWGYEVRSV